MTAVDAAVDWTVPKPQIAPLRLYELVAVRELPDTYAVISAMNDGLCREHI